MANNTPSRMPFYKRPHLKIGPFIGGLNNLSEPTSIADNEVQNIINFDIGLDGVLNSRPPVANAVDGPDATATMEILGYYVAGIGTYYPIGSKGRSGDLSATGVYALISGTWTLIVNISCRAVVQYNNYLWIIGENAAGGYWDGTTYTSVATMPFGGCAAVYKDRLYIGAGYRSTTATSRLYFSNAGDPTVWTSTDFIDIAKGDGQKLNDVYVQGNNVYLFKNDSTYVFSYDSAPTNGTLTKMSGTIGIAEPGAIVEYQGVLFVYHENEVYSLSSYIYTKLNTYVKFIPYNPSANYYFKPTALSIIGDRLVLTYFDKTYVYHLKVKAWSTWSSTLTSFGRFLQYPVDSNTYTSMLYYTYSNVSGNSNVYTLTDAYGAVSETMTCTVSTKQYTFSPGYYKKLKFWAIDIESSGSITGSVYPVSYVRGVPWSELTAYTWAQLAAYQWSQVSISDNAVTEVVSAAGTKARKFVKFLKALRFKSIYFKVTLTTTGTSTDSPVRLYSVNPVISEKEQLSARVS